MVLALIACAGVLVVGCLCLVAYAVHKLHKLSENAFVLARAKDAGDYVQSLDTMRPVAKTTPKAENSTPEPEKVIIDGRELIPVEPWSR